ncbi:phage tail tape measure protein [Pseudomonas sp. MWU13-3659]|uniref:phage tail tape measure protein n=1 Tax=Pseudomonas sp. MWU13-3659 TaxID=2986964 RepID=UPI0020763AF0|nr:phage tail tape measure protein [Pseudomonas sp. MWU13-3659]
MSASNASSRLDFILSLTDKVTAPLAKVTQGFNDLAEKSEANIRRIGTGVAGLWGSLSGIEASLEPALEVNRALGEVRSLGVAEDALDALNNKALEFSVSYGENAQEFVASAYKIEGAIKGLAGSQLATFTNTSSVLAKATKSDKEVMSEYVGTLYNLQKQQADAMGKSQWVEQLGGQTALAVQLFRTSGEQMKEGFKEAGAIATAAGVDLAEQMAVIGSLSSTMEGGDAGGRYKAFFENIENASDKLGMKFTDTNGKVLPMLDILAKLQGKFGDLRGAAANAKLMEAFGGEGAQVIGALAQDTDRLKNGIDNLGKVRGLEQAEKMAQAMVDPWQQFGQAVNALRISFGQVLIPLLQPLMTRLVAMGQTLTRWTKLFPNIARVMGIAALGVLALIAAFSGLAVISGVVGMLSLLASPIVLITIAIAALVIGVGLAIYYWDDLKASFGDSAWFQALIVVLTPIILLFRIFAALLPLLWTGLKQVFDFGMKVVDWLAEIMGVSTKAASSWDSFLLILAKISPFALLGKALKGVIALLNKIPGVKIDASFGDMPEVPETPKIPPQTVPVGVMPLPAPQLPLPTPQALMQVQPKAPLMTTLPAAVAPPAPVAKVLEQQPKADAPAVPEAVAKVAATPAMAAPAASIAPMLKSLAAMPAPTVQVQAPAPIEQAERSNARLQQAAPSVAPARPNAVPQGGLMKQVQNNTQTQDRRMHVEKVEINTGGKPLTPLELENLIGMAVG